MIVYKVYCKNYELGRGELLGVLLERRRELRGKTQIESGMRWAKSAFAHAVKDTRAIFVVPNEMKLGPEAKWLMEKAVFTKEEFLGMAKLVDQGLKR